MKLNNTIFKALLQKVECDTGDDLTTIGFSGEYRKYSISFYNEGNGLIIEEFVKEFKGGYIHITPSEEQKETLDKIIKDKERSLIEAREEEQRENERRHEEEGEIQNYLFSRCWHSSY